MNSNILKLVRNERGMSMAELARRSGLSRVTISNVESGKVNPTQNTISVICKVLNISPDFIFFNDNVNHEEQEIN